MSGPAGCEAPWCSSANAPTLKKPTAPDLAPACFRAPRLAPSRPGNALPSARVFQSGTWDCARGLGELPEGAEASRGCRPRGGGRDTCSKRGKNVKHAKERKLTLERAASTGSGRARGGGCGQRSPRDGRGATGRVRGMGRRRRQGRRRAGGWNPEPGQRGD